MPLPSVLFRHDPSDLLLERRGQSRCRRRRKSWGKGPMAQECPSCELHCPRTPMQITPSNLHAPPVTNQTTSTTTAAALTAIVSTNRNLLAALLAATCG